jgi:hypothetical protein
MSRRSRSVTGWLTLWVVVLAVCPASAPAADNAANLQTGVQRLGDALNKWFTKEERERLLTVGAFVSDDGEQAAEFKRLVEGHLAKASPPFQVRRSDLVLSGRLSVGKGRAKEEDRFDSVALRVEARLNERNTQGELQSFAINVFGNEAIQLLGPSVEFPKDLPETGRQKELDKQLGTKSEAFIDGNKTLGAAGGQFGIELLVRQGTSRSGTPRTPQSIDGRSFVKLVSGEECIIRLHNGSTEEAAVALTIDGLSMFAFAEDGTGDSFILIPPGKTVDIPGWYITGKKTDVFEVSNYAKSAAAAKALPASGIGVITARFHISLPGDGKGEEATKRGRQIDQEYRQERRVIGENRAFVTVRYNRDGK